MSAFRLGETDRVSVFREEKRIVALSMQTKYRSSYNRTAHLTERRKMMQQWADYPDKLKAGAG